MADEQKVAAVKISFHAVILTSEGELRAESFETVEELVTRIRALVNQDVTVFAFRGERLHISKPPTRHLLVPGDVPIPLFELFAPLEPDETGYLGVDPINLAGPPQLATPPASRSGAGNTQPDLFQDDEANVFNVFDDSLPDPDSN